MSPTSTTPIAYFCAEFGLDTQLPFYAGGLGILAGDTMKEAADRNLPFVGVGLLYRGERMVQKINDDGLQEEVDMPFDPVAAGLEHVYLDEQPLFIKVNLTDLSVWCRIWKKTLAPNTVLYLLDTDTDQNQMSERSITHALYSGTDITQLQQQLILGIGGVKLLHALGLHPAVFHLNEGRPAFLHWQLVRYCMDKHGMTFDEARRMARQKTVYTNHTLVAAGNNSVDCNVLKQYAGYYADKMGVTVEQLLEAGLLSDTQQATQSNPIQTAERFYMTTFALNSSCRASGVSQLHTELSKQIWPNYQWVNVTNGVHMPTWQDPNIAKCDLQTDQLWQLHLANKRRLADFVAAQTGFSYPPERLVITWARRLAGYKRLEALFEDVEKLRSLLRHSTRPVQLLIAGKAHIQDKDGKIMLQRIIKFMAKELADHALFIPNYNIEIARQLVAGSDLWVNLPEEGKEACGTSGMKALSNGVLQCTVADGWAHEVDWQGLGWTLDSNQVATDFYDKFSNQIAPLYYDRDGQGVPQAWLTMMKKSVQLAGQFSTKRMLDEYQALLYDATGA